MLNFIRKSVTSWAGIAVLVLALGAMTITLFQGQAPDVTGPGGQRSAVMATVGKNAIGEDELMQAVENTVENERQSNPGTTMASFAASGGTATVLQQLVFGRTVTEYAAAHGMSVSRRMVDGQIASIPAFQVNGKFDENRFRQYLQMQSVKEDALRAGIASDMLRDQLLRPLGSVTAVPQGMVNPFIDLLLEEHEGTVLPVPTAAMPQPGQPGDDALKAFYDSHHALFTIPERRSFRYAFLDRDALKKKAAPTPDAVRAYYDKHLADYGGVEKRTVHQVVLGTEEKARAFVASVKAGTSFAEAAAKDGFAASDTALGTLSEKDLADATSDRVAKAAFALPAGATSAPLKSDFGWAVVAVAKIVPAAATPFANVRDAIARQLADEKLADLQSDAVSKAEDQFDAGQSFAAVAASVGGQPTSVADVTRAGILFDKAFKAQPQNLPAKLLETVFAADPADGPHVADLDDGQVALYEVGDVVAPTVIPLAPIRDRVVSAWRFNTRLNAAKKLADTLAKEAAGSKDLAKIAGAHPLPPTQKLAVRRIDLTQAAQQGQQIPPPVLMMVSLPAGKTQVMPAPEGQGWFVIKADSVKAGDKSAAGQLEAPVRDELKRQVGNEFVESFMRAIGREVGVVRYPERLKAFDRKVAGGSEDD